MEKEEPAEDNNYEPEIFMPAPLKMEPSDLESNNCNSENIFGDYVVIIEQPGHADDESTKASTTEVQTITSRKRKKSNAQRCREYRERKKLQNTMERSDECSETDQLPAKKPKTDAERRKKYYEAQKLKKQKSKKIPKTAKQRSKEYYYRKKKFQALNTLNHHSVVEEPEVFLPENSVEVNREKPLKDPISVDVKIERQNDEVETEEPLMDPMSTNVKIERQDEVETSAVTASPSPSPSPALPPPEEPAPRRSRPGLQGPRDSDIVDTLTYKSDPGTGDSDDYDDSATVVPGIPRVFRSTMETPLNADLPMDENAGDDGDAEHKFDSMAALVNVECCLTDYLLTEETSFSKLSFENKKHVIQLGRARPDIIISYKRRDGFFKHFNSSLYDKYPWLTGSCKLNKMFCFPCMLFSDSSSLWSHTGFNDINNLTNSSKKHVQTEKHIRSCLSLHDFENRRIETFFANTYEIHNKKVDRNRSLMKRFIDTVILLGKQELVLRGNHENPASDNRGNYIETLLYLSKYDSVIDSHLEQCSSTQNPTFSGLSLDIQNDLIQSIAFVLCDQIKFEINKAEFVSVMIDETPDVSLKKELTVILRYLSETGIEERFLGFYDVSCSRTADDFSNQLLEILDQYRCRDKLIGQSYDGAAVMSGELEGVQTKIREACPRAMFVPCYAHVLNLVLSQSLENIQELKTFFGHINSIVRFFNKSSKRSNLLKEIADRRLPGVSETRWHYHSRIINVIFNCRLDMIETFYSILDNPQSWDSESLSLAECFLSKLENKQFCFFLHILCNIFEKTDVLFNLLQSKQIDIEVALHEIDSFNSWISNDFINNFDFIYDSVQEFSEPPRQRRRLNSESDTRTLYRRLFIEIIDNVKSQIQHRYQSLSNMTFLNLLNKSKYSFYSRSFPNEMVSSLLVQFPRIFEFAALKNELKVLYTTPSLNKLDVYELYLSFQNSFLGDTFPQVLTLCSIFLTIPITVASADRSFSALKRIRTYVRNSQKQERLLSDLAMLSIEKRLLLKIQSQPSFYDNVLAHFVKKNRRIALEYKYIAHFVKNNTRIALEYKYIAHFVKNNTRIALEYKTVT